MATTSSAGPLAAPGRKPKPPRVNAAQLHLAASIAHEIVRAEVANPLFRAVMDASHVGFLVLSTRGQILYANRALAELTGYTLDELHAFPSADVLTPRDDRERSHEILRNAVDERRDAKPRHRFMVHKNGSIVPVTASAAPMVVEGDVVGLVCQFASREAEELALDDARAHTEALRVANAELAVYRQMVARASDEVLIIQAGRVVVRNGAYRQWLGYDLHGRTIEQLFGPEHIAAAAEAIAAIEAGTSEAERITFTLTDRANRTVEMEATLSPIELNDAIAVVAVARDITERVEFERRQRATERLEALGRVSAGAAHELANTLGSLTGAISPGSSIELIEAVERARQLSSGLALVGGQAVGRPEPLSVRKVIEAAVATLPPALAKRVRIEVANAATVRGRSADLVLALGALITNALEAGNHAATVRLSTTLGLPDNAYPVAISPDGYCQIEIIDRGGGMSPDVLGRLFEPFFTTRPGHTGMGSSLAYAVIRSHGGQTTAESTTGAGTSVRVYLPRTKAKRGRRVPRAERRSAETHRVLLVDDNRALRAVTAAMLTDAGYLVTECDSAASAGEAIAKEPTFHALIVDMRLGDGTGLDVFEQAGGAESGPPTLFISGYSGEDLGGLPQSKGWRFMAKPFSGAELLAQLKKLVGTRAPAGARATASPAGDAA